MKTSTGIELAVASAGTTAAVIGGQACQAFEHVQGYNSGNWALLMGAGVVTIFLTGGRLLSKGVDYISERLEERRNKGRQDYYAQDKLAAMKETAELMRRGIL